MSEDDVIFGLHAVRTLLQQRPERASLAGAAEGPRDARATELMRSRRPRACAPSGATRASSIGSPASERHQGACLQIRAARRARRRRARRVARQAHGAAAAARARRRAGPAQPRRLPADRRCCRRQRGHRAARSRGGLSPTVRKVASGAAETMPLIQVVEPGAHAALAEGARDLDRRRPTTRRRSRSSRREADRPARAGPGRGRDGAAPADA